MDYEKNVELFTLDLTPWGAPGYSLSDRLDMTGHESGLTCPHINTDLINPADKVMGGKLYRDLSDSQVDGFNGMQNDW